ncbi:MAG: peroxide stress protein YaaA [Acidobacteria bacterium]|nr:peroxide stress protein YaaA [Acidobacteriota bacterium]
MLFLLSPAKKLDYDTPAHVETSTQPLFVDRAKKLISVLKTKSADDVAGLIAPRPLFCESGVKDPIFPINAFKESFANVSKVYETFGAQDRIGHEIHPGAHVFSGKQGLPFLAKHLKA